MQSSNLYQRLWPLAFLSSAVASMSAQAAGLLGLMPHLSSCSLPPAHLLLPPFGSHGAEVSKEMALGPRDPLFIYF